MTLAALFSFGHSCLERQFRHARRPCRCDHVLEILCRCRLVSAKLIKRLPQFQPQLPPSSKVAGYALLRSVGRTGSFRGRVTCSSSAFTRLVTALLVAATRPTW